MTLYMCW